MEFITVTGARENNLRDVSVRVPKRAITFSAFIRGFLPRLGQPDADLIENLSTAIVVGQRRLGGGSRSTLGTFNHPVGMCADCSGIGQRVQLDHEAFFDRSDGGDAGGRVVFEGPPGELIGAPGSFTGEHLARYAGAVAAG